MEERWPFVTIRVPPSATAEAWEIFCAFAMEAGSTGYEEAWMPGSDVPVSADFSFPSVTDEDNAAVERARRTIAELAEAHLGAEAEVSARLLADEKWAERWREFYHPTLITPTLAVGPPDGKPPAEAAPGCNYIRIELGSAFGTGGHATTRGCLIMIEELLRGRDHGIEHFLDLGTGSGVLSFAALMFGCQRATGIDADHHAEPTFKWNAELNGLEDRALFVLGNRVEKALDAAREAGAPPPGMTVCNMITRDFDPLLEPLRTLVPRPVILSGILREDSEPLLARLAQTNWRMQRDLWIEDWGTWYCLPD